MVTHDGRPNQNKLIGKTPTALFISLGCIWLRLYLNFGHLSKKPYHRTESQLNPKFQGREHM